MPVQLNTQFCRATVVFDATDYIDEKGVPVVGKQCDLMFHTAEYWYLPQKEFSPLEPGAADKFVEKLEERITNRLLSNTGMKINMFFYCKLQDTDAEKADALKAFIKRVALLLMIPTMELHSFVVASKFKQNNEEAMNNLMALADRFVGVQDIYSPQLMLMEALPLSKIDGAVRATVRVANIFSRNGALYDILQAKTAARNLWNWNMSEFDEDAFISVKAELESINHSLNDNSPFPSGELQNNLRTVQNREEQKNIGGCSINAENIPIPAATIKKGLIFGGKAAEEAVTKFSSAVRDTFRCNMERKCFPKYTQAEMFDICRIMTTNIPLSRWSMIKDEIVKALPEIRMKKPDPRVSLHSSPSISAMREQLTNQLREMSKDVRNYYPQYIAEQLIEHMDEYLSSDEVKAEERRLRDLASELEVQISANNGIKEGTEYLAGIVQISSGLLSLYYRSFFEKNQYILISNRINEQWQEKYAAYLPSQINANSDVYNFMDLQEFEFQTLTLLSFRREELEAGKTMMFRLEGSI